MSTARNERHRCRATLAAYTVVEVMMALAVLSIGATGVVAMQKAALIGNVRARNLATANAIATAWMERLRTDSLRWKLRQNGTTTINQTQWLNWVGDEWATEANIQQIVSPEDEWRQPNDLGNNSLGAGIEPSADVRGMDVDILTPNLHGFCTHVRLVQVLPDMIRAEVRVFWLRNHNTNVSTSYAGTFGGKPMCESSQGYVNQLSTDEALGRYHFVYLSSAIWRAP